jgi:DNA gyrase subunit A
MGRSAAGVKGIELSDGDHVVGLIRVDDGADLLTITGNGFGKRTPLLEYLVHSEDGSTRAQGRGGKGRRDIRTGDRNGDVVAVKCVREGDSLMLISAGGMLVRIPVASVRQVGRNTLGVRLVKLKDEDRLIAAARIADSDDSGQEAPLAAEGSELEP